MMIWRLTNRAIDTMRSSSPLRMLSWLIAALAAGCEEPPLEGEVSSPRILWRMDLEKEEIYAWRGQPAVQGGNAYWKTMSGLLSFDMRTGKRRWATPLPIRSLQAPNVLLRDGMLAIGDWWGVAVLEAETGRVVWSVSDTTKRHDTFLDAHEGKLFHFVSNDSPWEGPFEARIRAVDIRTGALRWERLLLTRDTFQIIPHAVAVRDDTIYVLGSKSLSRSGHLKTVFAVALRPDDGWVLWEYQMPGEFHTASASVTVFDNLLILGDLFGSGFYALDRADGHEVWRIPGDLGWMGPAHAPRIHDGIAYGVSGDRKAYAFDPASGALKWTTRLPASAHQLAICGRYLLVENEAVMLLELETGRIVDSLLNHPDGTEIPTSGFAVWGDIAAISTDNQIIGFSCE